MLRNQFVNEDFVTIIIILSCTFHLLMSLDVLILK